MIGKRLLQLTKDTAIYGLGSALTGVIGIVLVPMLTRTLSPTEYGLLDLLTTTVFLSSVIFALGFDSALGILFFKEENFHRRQRLIITALWTVTLVSSAGALVAALFFEQLRHALLGASMSGLPIAILLIVVPISLFQGFLLTSLRLQFRRRAYLLAMLTHVVAVIGLSLLFVAYARLGIAGYMLAWLCACAMTSLIALTGVGNISLTRFDPSSLRDLFRIGWPLIPAGLAGWSLSLIDRFFVKHYSIEELGYYALAVKISSILGLLTAALQLAWGPFALSIAREPEAKATYSRVLTLYFALTGGVMILLTATNPLIISILSGSGYEAAGPAVLPLLLGSIAYGSYSILAIGSTIAEKTYHISWTTLLAALVNIGLNFLFIPTWGIVGASYATAISYSISALCIAYMSQRYFPIPYSLSVISLVALSSFGGSWLISRSDHPLLIGLAVLIIYTIGIFSFRVIDLQALQGLRGKR